MIIKKKYFFCICCCFLIFGQFYCSLHHFKAKTTTNSELFEMLKYFERFLRYSKKKKIEKFLSRDFLNKLAILKSSKSKNTVKLAVVAIS